MYMNFLNEKIICSLYFNVKEDNTIKSKKFEAKLNPYTGSISHKFVPFEPQKIIFKFNSEWYTYSIRALGGKYFIIDYEDSPFKRLFNTHTMLKDKSEPEKKKLKI